MTFWKYILYRYEQSYKSKYWSMMRMGIKYSIWIGNIASGCVSCSNRSTICRFVYLSKRNREISENNLNVNMLRRNLIIVFKPIKSTSVVLSELNHRLMNLGVSCFTSQAQWTLSDSIFWFFFHIQDTGNSCINITNNYVDHYCSWLPYGGHTIRDTEIGINASVAEALG